MSYRDLVTKPQPLPLDASGDVWAEIIATLPEGPARQAAEARRQMGIDKYGTPLQRGNGRDHAVDEAQELLDAAVYRAARLGADDPLVGVYLLLAAGILRDIS